MHAAYISIGMSSALFSSFELSRRLANDGARVTYLSQAPIGDLVRAQGYDFVPLEQDRQIRERLEAVPGLASRRRRIAERRAIRRASMSGDEIRAVLRRLSPDILLVDFEMHLAILTTASLGLPTVLIKTLFSVFRRPDVPPMHRTGRPAQSSTDRWRIRAQWWRLRLETIHMNWRGRIARWRRGDFWPPVFYDSVGVDELGAVARKHGFPIRREVSRRQWLRPWIYTRLPILCCNAYEVDFPQEGEQLPKNQRYVGPMVYFERRPTPEAEPCLEAWRAFETGRDRGRPLVYASLGTYWSADVELLQRIVGVFERRRDWDLVLGLGGRLKADSLGPVPNNVLILEHAPQLDVLRRAQAAIVHGGVGTLNECLLLEVPMVVCSTGFVDQNGCASRLDALGLGLLGDRQTNDSCRLEELLVQALNDGDLRDRLSRTAELLKGYERSNLAVRWIQALAAAGKDATFESIPRRETKGLRGDDGLSPSWNLDPDFQQNECTESNRNGPSSLI